MSKTARISILAVSAPIAAFFFGISLHAFWIYLELVRTPFRWSLVGLYRTGGGLVFPGLAWLVLFLLLRRGLDLLPKVILVALFALETGAAVWLAERAQQHI